MAKRPNAINQKSRDADAAFEAIWQLKNVIESRELSVGTKITDVRTKLVKDTVSLRASLANYEAAPKAWAKTDLV